MQSRSCHLNANLHCAISTCRFQHMVAMHRFDVAIRTAPQLLAGRKLRVYWPDDDGWYLGTVTHFDAETGKHKVCSYGSALLTCCEHECKRLHPIAQQWQAVAINVTLLTGRPFAATLLAKMSPLISFVKCLLQPIQLMWHLPHGECVVYARTAGHLCTCRNTILACRWNMMMVIRTRCILQ